MCSSDLLGCPLFLLAYTFSVKAAEPEAGSLERGSRIVTSMDAKIGPEGSLTKVILREHPEDDGLLDLVLQNSELGTLQSRKLIYALDRDEEDVSSYGVSVKQMPNGSFSVSAVKDWGTSVWSNRYVISFRNGDFLLSGYDYEFSYREKSGKCSLNLLKGDALVNGRHREISAAKISLENADGLDLLKTCQELLAK